jgi:hypothetical protein
MQPPLGNHTVKATSTVSSAFRDPFNLFMIISACLLIAVSLFQLRLAGLSLGWLALLIAVGVFLFFYVRAIINREIEISEDGIRYREAFIHLFFPWSDIEAIKIERAKKQITIWTAGKFRRIHEFGLPREELALVRQTLKQQIELRHIAIR